MHYCKYSNFFYHFIYKLLDFHVLRGVIAWSIEVFFEVQCFIIFFFRNQQLIQDKYCLRGAEWGIGDCSTQGMTEQERNDFVTMLKKKTGEQ